MNEEKMRILKMIEEGKISADEGARLMDLVDEDGGPADGPARIPGGGSSGKIHILVTDIDTGKVKTDIRIPAGFLNAGKGILTGGLVGERLREEGVDLQDIFSGDHNPGDVILDVEDHEDGERVVITFE